MPNLYNKAANSEARLLHREYPAPSTKNAHLTVGVFLAVGSNSTNISISHIQEIKLPDTVNQHADLTSIYYTIITHFSAK